MGNWWIDEEPGPKERPAPTFSEIKEFYTSLGMNIAKATSALGTAFAEMGEDLAKAFSERRLEYNAPSAKPPTTREEVLERKKKNQHGPYGGGFDRRGRKY